MISIQTCLWMNHEAEEAAKFYTSLFDGRILRTIPYGKAAAKASGQPVGGPMTVEFEIAGSSFLALNGGPHFRFNPSISFFVSAEKDIDRLWAELNVKTRMPLQRYPFAEKYGWCVDRFGVNWQLMSAETGQTISPALLFANKKFGQAGKAIEFYNSVFPNSKVDMVARDEKTKAVLHSRFSLAGQNFVIMEGPLEPDMDFSPAVSFVIRCQDQNQIDRMWSALSAVPQAEQCGWLCDQFGVSWQVVHRDWGVMLENADPAGRERLMAAILKMKKPNLEVLERALRG
ncbi:MAG: VOC family protein [Bdellovibrio sp.]|nr:MAG: VOC family protein [Bdellovibrio sp.]